MINNAGIVQGPKVFDVNIKSMTYTVKEFMPTMIETNRGHIVTMASVSGFVGGTNMAEYAATKAAAIQYDECLRHEINEIKNVNNVTTT